MLSTIKKYLSNNKELVIHVVLCYLYFSSLNVHWTENWMDRSLRPVFPSPLSVLLAPIVFYLNAFVLIPKLLKGKYWFLYFFWVGLVWMLAEYLRTWVYFNYEQQVATIVEEFWSRDNLINGGINSMSFPLVFSFAYRFTRDWILNNRTIEKLKNEKLQMELNLLKSQVNPHFLFNNLNALDDLIDKDKNLAKEYLHKLSNMYRYSIVNMENDLVALEKEWDFMQNYIFLIEKRFGLVYQFNETIQLDDLDNYLIPPASLQGLLENVVKHNYGTPDQPLQIEINANENGIKISH